MATPRTALRLLQSTSRQHPFSLARQHSLSLSLARQPSLTPTLARRAQSGAAGVPLEGVGQSAPRTGFAKLWDSPVGPKTVHFWAPIMKWGIVLAGIADFARPASALSLTQNGALVATGAIWTRWCFVIKPRNVFLATVNFFMFLVGVTQVTRIFLYRRSQEGLSVGEQLSDAAREEGRAVEGMVRDPKAAAERAAQT